MVVRMEIPFLMFAFGIGGDLLLKVRTYKYSAIMSLSLLFAFFGCQVDRLVLWNFSGFSMNVSFM